jgi:hypothetical protein
MTSEDQVGKTSLSVEEIAAEARPLAVEDDFGKMAQHFLSTLHSWAQPSAVLCLCKDASAEGGWRSVSELALGPVSPAFERSIVKLIEDSAPGSLSQPVPVRPRDDAPGSGVKVRDNWLVPWAHGQLSGYLFIRGIAHSVPSFGSAVALLAQTLWPRLPGTPGAEGATKATAAASAAPLPALLDQAQQFAERLTGALREERERLASQHTQQAARSEDLAEKLVAAQRTRLEIESERDQARADVLVLKGRLAELASRAQSAASNEQLDTLRRRVNELEGHAGELTERLAESTKARREFESERDGARAEAVALRGRLEAALAKAQPGPSEDKSEALQKRANELEGRASELAEKLSAAEKAQVDLTSERDSARSEAAALKSRAEAAEAPSAAAQEQSEACKKRVDELEGRIGELGEKLAAAEKAQADLASERDRAREEVVTLRARIGDAPTGSLSLAAEAQADNVRKRTAELEGRVAELSEKLAAAEKAQAEAQSERDAARSELTPLKSKVAGLEAQMGDDMHWEPVASEEVETLQKQLAALDTKYNDAEKARIEAVAERDKLRSAAAAGPPVAGGAPEGAETAAGGEGELSRAKAEANRLWQTVESLQLQLQKEAERLSEVATEKEGLSKSLAEAMRERDAAQATLLAANEGMQESLSRERGRGAQWTKLIESFRATADAMRRTPFVPPALRIAFSGAEEALAVEGETQARPTAGRTTGRVLFLDRDTAGVERIASELEAAGLEVLIAHYPEEVGFFLKTPDARKLTAMVCDVMAFRGDQNLLDLFRAWRQDQSNLALLLSFKADSAAETEKAQRIPVVLTAGYLTRPLDRQAVLDAVGMIARRQGPR